MKKLIIVLVVFFMIGCASIKPVENDPFFSTNKETEMTLEDALDAIFSIDTLMTIVFFPL